MKDKRKSQQKAGEEGDQEVVTDSSISGVDGDGCSSKKASKIDELVSLDNSFGVADRWRRFNANVDYLQSIAKERLSTKYKVMGDHYVLHFSPRLAAYESRGGFASIDSFTDDATSSAGSEVEASRKRSFGSTSEPLNAQALAKLKEEEAEMLRHMRAICEKNPGIDLFTRPNVEKAVNARLGIECDDRPSLRFAVNAVHSKDNIDRLLSDLLAAATWE
jgi:hypothetical protein